MEASVSLKSVGKRINKKVALAGMSFGIEKGSKFAVIGHSNSGKSTILKLLAGIISKDKGSLYINGKDINLNPLEIKSEIGYMPKKNDFFNDLSIVENISLYGEIFNISRRKSIEQASILCEKLNLSNYLHEKSRNVNNGIIRIAMFARAILHNPKIIIMDQPTLGLDSRLKTALWSFLLKYGERKTIIYSVNTVNQIQDNCDRVAVVNNYEIKFIGTYNNFIDSFDNYRLKDVI